MMIITGRPDTHTLINCSGNKFNKYLIILDYYKDLIRQIYPRLNE